MPSILGKLNKWSGVVNVGDTMMSVEEDLRSILVKWKKDDSIPLHSSTKLGDLNIDSLDLVEVMFEIEEKFDVSLTQSHQEAREASFVDLSSWIEQQLVLQQAGAVTPKPAITLVKPAPLGMEDKLETLPQPQ